MGVEFELSVDPDLWSTTAMTLVLDFKVAVERIEFELFELIKTGQIIKQNPLRYMN